MIGALGKTGRLFRKVRSGPTRITPPLTRVSHDETDIDDWGSPYDCMAHVWWSVLFFDNNCFSRSTSGVYLPSSESRTIEMSVPGRTRDLGSLW